MDIRARIESVRDGKSVSDGGLVGKVHDIKYQHEKTADELNKLADEVKRLVDGLI